MDNVRRLGTNSDIKYLRAESVNFCLGRLESHLELIADSVEIPNVRGSYNEIYKQIDKI
jgi:hypothetical protein